MSMSMPKVSIWASAGLTHQWTMTTGRRPNLSVTEEPHQQAILGVDE